MTKARAEVAGWFKATDEAAGANFADEIYPGYPGLVVAEGALRAMGWGFPLVMKGARGHALKPKPVNNARTDRLGTAFWRDSFTHRRCLIPVTAWAEAEGQRGAMTRSWLARTDAELFAVAGVWRMSAEWGAVFSMIMTEACGAAAQCHTRMPVLLADADCRAWTTGSPSEAANLCLPWEGPLTLDRTAEPWAKAKPSPAVAPAQGSLL